MQRPLSLTLRLTLFIAIAAMVVFAGFGWFIERSLDQHFSAEDSEELEVIAEAVANMISSEKTASDTNTLTQRFNDILIGHHAASLYVANKNGEVIFTSSTGPNLITQANTFHGNTSPKVILWNDGENRYRVLNRYLKNNNMSQSEDIVLSVAVAIDYHELFINKFRLTLWSMVASGIVAMGIMGWIAVRQGHAPLRRIVAKMRQISTSDLNTRLSPETVPKELSDLAASFNEMLARMEEGFQRLSHFSDDIAHELRTPITNLLTQTQVALSQTRSVNEYREILYSNMEEYERMAQMIGDMLFLAKADNKMFEPNATQINLVNEVRDLFEFYEAWAEECGIKLSFSGDGCVTGDRPMLRRAISNLLSNAIRHTPPDNTVLVELKQPSKQQVAISVTNPGPTVSPEHLPRLFDRFYRADIAKETVGEGAGLGLAITKSIVDIHGGRIEANSEDGLTEFRITLNNSKL